MTLNALIGQKLILRSDEVTKYFLLYVLTRLDGILIMLGIVFAISVFLLDFHAWLV